MNVWPVYRHSGCEGDYVRSAAHFTVPLNEGLIPTNDVGKCFNFYAIMEAILMNRISVPIFWDIFFK